MKEDINEKRVHVIQDILSLSLHLMEQQEMSSSKNFEENTRYCWDCAYFQIYDTTYNYCKKKKIVINMGTH